MNEPTLRRHAALLDFGTEGHECINLSGAAFLDDWLWVVGDEAASVELLRCTAPSEGQALHFTRHASFPLATVLDLPGDPEDEADLEGMAICDGWLWLVGSHGLKRKNAKAGRDDATNARRLSRIQLDGNRRLLARIPIEPGPDGTPRLAQAAADGRRALRLKGDVRRNGLIELLEEDEHLAPFLAIPGKDNGFDIEGLAVDDRRLLLGLRGPVLRGWTLLLEVAVEAHGGWLKLAPLEEGGPLLRKHFLQLGGLGVRDLHFDGDDLFLLAGPTMVLDGDVRLFHWPNARRTLAENRDAVRFQTDFPPPVHLSHTPGHDRAEAFCEVPASLLGGAPGWLVLYDAPGADRRPQPQQVLGDLLRLR